MEAKVSCPVSQHRTLSPTLIRVSQRWFHKIHACAVTPLEATAQYPLAQHHPNLKSMQLCFYPLESEFRCPFSHSQSLPAAVCALPGSILFPSILIGVPNSLVFSPSRVSLMPLHFWYQHIEVGPASPQSVTGVPGSLDSALREVT